MDELVDYGFIDVLGVYSDLGGLLIFEGVVLEVDGSVVCLGDDCYFLYF